MKIQELEIYTAQLHQQKLFYRQILELETRSEDQNSFEVTLGFSKLKFVKRETANPYHIAIHIPSSNEEQALGWLRDRVNILKSGREEIIDFSNWNARSIYFYDEDQNIMELISRRDFLKPGSQNFSSQDFLGIAEIGLATNDIATKFEILNKKCQLEIYDGNLDKFCAIGDDEGLFITINKNLKNWFPTEDKAYSSGFKIKFENKGNNFELQFAEDELKLN